MRNDSDRHTITMCRDARTAPHSDHQIRNAGDLDRGHERRATIV
jgi:hypothetical protein